MKTKQQLCVLCGINTATTKEHVPPKTIFLYPRPSNLITVPSCKQCNNGTSKNDEKFKVYLGLHSAMYSIEGEKLFQEVLRTLERSPKLKKQVLRGMKDADAYTPSGIKLLGYKIVPWDSDVYVKTLTKITRGLFFHHFKAIADSNIIIKEYFFNEDPDIPKDMLYGTVIVKGVFEYYYNRIENTNSSIWLYKFYEGHWGGMIFIDINHKNDMSFISSNIIIPTGFDLILR